MKDTIMRTLTRWRQSFSAFTAGQKVVAIIGTAALLLGGFMVYRWASAPTYVPLFSDLSASDASAVVQQLDTEGVPYQLGDGGGTVMVPKSAVYKTRIDLSAQGLPTDSDSGYSILDDNGLSTSDFQEQTDFKRAMEGELAKTVEGIDQVDTAVVHLVLPEKQVFSDEQDPPTASVLIDTGAGSRLGEQQVQAIVHLVASSIEGLDPKNVTVSDTQGLLTGADDGGTDSSARTQLVDAKQEALHDEVQAMLDRIVGPGNSTVQATVDLDFDASTTHTTTFSSDTSNPIESSTINKETYSGTGAGSTGVGGVVGVDGQMDPTASATGGADPSYAKTSETSDKAVGSEVKEVQTAPGSVSSQHLAIVLDTPATVSISEADVQKAIKSGAGIDVARGDTLSVSKMPFDRTAEKAAAKELAAAHAADAAAARNDLLRKVGLGVFVALMLLLAVIKGRRRSKKRDEATTYVVEQLREQSAARLVLDGATAPLALAGGPDGGGGLSGDAEARAEDDAMREELNALIERQPEDVAALLRGWLTERV